jgi:DNA-binding XRE family transcriptional regulator
MKLENLRKLRKEKGLTEEQAAKIFSVSLKSYNAWEQGDFQPKIETLIEMANYFDTTIDYIVGREETVFKPEEKDVLRMAASIIDKKMGEK